MTTQTDAVPSEMADWERDIRGLEDLSRSAFLAGDLEALNLIWAEGYAVNSPLQQVALKPQVLALLESGRIRHTTYEYGIEHIARHGDVVIVMGTEQVTGPPDGVPARRRFTNVWQLQDGQWRSIARHAHVVSGEPAG